MFVGHFNMTVFFFLHVINNNYLGINFILTMKIVNISGRLVSLSPRRIIVLPNSYTNRYVNYK